MRLLGLVAAAALAAMPVVAQATVTIDAPGLIQDGAVPISIGDVFTIEIFGDAVDEAGSVAFGFTATEQLLAIETNSLNPPFGGFQGATVEWNSAADGSGTSFGSISGLALRFGAQLATSFGVNETKYLIASWNDVAADRSNFDLRVAAIPLPASILMLLGAIGGLGYIGRRRAVATA